MDKPTWPTGVRPSGTGIRIKVWRDGKLAYSETLQGDPYSKADLASAVRRREWLESRLRLGLPLHQDDQQATQELFAELAQDYINSLDTKTSTADDYLRILNRHWMPRFGNHIKTEITTRMIKRALNEIEVGGKTKKNILIPLRGVFDHGEVNPNPVGALGKKGKREQKPRIERYTPEQRQQLVEGLSGQPQVYFALLFGTGLRPGEALGLMWSDYNGTHLHVTKQITRRRLEPTTKTCEERTVYVPQWVRAYLNDHTTRFKKGHIFLNSKGTPCLDTDILNDAWREVHTRLKIDYKIPYTCRHTRAAELLSTKVDPAEAAKQMGHTLEMFFRTYAEWIEEYSGKKDDARFEGLGIKSNGKKTNSTKT